MSNIEIKAGGLSDDEIARKLRKIASVYDRAAWRRWEFWIGFVWGAIVIAALNMGDVWVCVGACGDAPRAEQQREEG